MTRGNQRELAREKNSKKQGKAVSSKETSTNKGLTLEERRLRDAQALKAKQEAKKNAVDSQQVKQ